MTQRCDTYCRTGTAPRLKLMGLSITAAGPAPEGASPAA